MSGTIERIERRIRDRRHGHEHWPAILGLTVVLGLGYAVTGHPRDVVTEHHVIILGEDEDGDFPYLSDEEPKGGSFRICEDDIKDGLDVRAYLRRAMLKGGKGYEAERATWEERGICKSIIDPNWGFWFKDQANNFKPRRIDYGSQR